MKHSLSRPHPILVLLVSNLFQDFYNWLELFFIEKSHEPVIKFLNLDCEIFFNLDCGTF